MGEDNVVHAGKRPSAAVSLRLLRSTYYKSMPPPDSFNRGLAPPCIWAVFEHELIKARAK